MTTVTNEAAKAADPETFQRFHELLTKDEPGYVPFYLQLRKNSKDPVLTGKWKENRLTFEKAYELMKDGYNIGIAGTDYDRLVIVDSDDMGMVGNTKPTLQAVSRKRIGAHNYYFTDDKPRDNKTAITTLTAKDNIPVEKAGEVRSKWQYVVAPGSFVPVGPEGMSRIPEEDRANAGKYSLANEMKPADITFHELPEVFKNKRIANMYNELENEYRKTQRNDIEPDRHSNSALFNITPRELYGTHRSRFPSPLHGSETGKNTSISGDLMHCWRCNVSLSGYACLAVETGLYDCCEAGKPHMGGSSYLRYDGEEIFTVWKYAKEHNHIPDNDPIPTKALIHFATENGICKESDIVDGWKLPADAYNRSLAALREDGINPGRTPIGEAKEEDIETLSSSDIRKLKEAHLNNRMNMDVLPDDHFLTVFRKWQETRTDAYSDYHFMGGLWLLSAFCQGKVVLKLKSGHVIPNLWVQILGLTTISHKTTSIENTQYIYETVTEERAYNNIYSLEGYLEDLQKTPVANYIYDEVAGLLAKMHAKYNDGIFDLDCALYGGKSIQKTLASKKGQPNVVTVDNPCVTKLYGTTPEKYTTNIQQVDFDCGWGFRFLFCWPRYKKGKMGLAVETQEDVDARATVIARALKIYQLIDQYEELPFTVEPGVLAYLDSIVEYHENIAWNTDNDAYAAATGRGQENCLKIAMLLELGKSKPSFCITLDTMKYAADLVFNYFVPTTLDVCDRIQEDIRNNQIEKIISLLRKSGGVGEHSKTLKDSKIMGKIFNDCINTMLESGAIKVYKEEGTGKRQYVLQSGGERKKFDPTIPQILKIPPILQFSHGERGVEKKVNLISEDTSYTPTEYFGFLRELENLENLENSENSKDGKNQIPPRGDKKTITPCSEISTTVEKMGNVNTDIEDSLDLWEKTASPIFAKNAHKAKLDIPQFHKMFGIDPQLIYEAVDRRSAGRCVECGADNPNNTSDDGKRCKPCHDIYSNPPAVVIPEEFNLEEPVEVRP